jgi:membrane-bound inhibitor of C-type lysozyme
MRKKILITALILAAAATIGYYGYLKFFFARGQSSDITNNNQASEIQDSKKIIASAFYVCDSGLTIKAQYYSGETKQSTDPNEPPIPGGSVKLAFSTGENYDLPQTISADGARYGLADDSFIFWSKGNGAFIMKSDQITEKNCLVVKDDSGNLPNIYASSSLGFSLRYPKGYVVNKDYFYQEFGPGKDISGVSFTIPETMATGTNLSAGSYLSVEQITNATSCSANLFLDIGSSTPTVVTDGDYTYSIASSTGAGAGNRYEETVYAVQGSENCLAIRYFIHYSVLENYPAGAVKAFDRDAILRQFDSIRKTLTLQ